MEYPENLAQLNDLVRQTIEELDGPKAEARYTSWWPDIWDIVVFSAFDLGRAEVVDGLDGKLPNAAFSANSAAAKAIRERIRDRLVEVRRRLEGGTESPPNGIEHLPEEEPDDLHKVRVAAHQCAEALYVYLRFAITLLETGEDPEFESFKGQVLDGPDRTGAEYAADDFQTPILRLEALVRLLVGHVNELMDKHGAFQDVLEPLTDELGSVYAGLQEISGLKCRSHCKALESFAFHVVRYTFDGTQKFTPESEIPPGLTPDDAIPFTASNWHKTLKLVISSFPSIDVEDFVHEAIEQEIADAWTLRNPQSTSPRVADKGRKIRQQQPDNVDVRDLCKLLEKSRAQIAAGKKTEIGVAREHTKEQVGACPKADNLLRQARRYPHLWK